MMRRRGNYRDLDGGNVMAWKCTAASGTGPLVFTDDSAKCCKLIRQRFILQIDNEPKDTAGVSRGK